MFDDGQRTSTTKAQQGLENKLRERHRELWEADSETRIKELTLKREEHVEYVQRHLGKLSENFTVLDASQTWIAFWNLHSLALMEAPLPQSLREEDLVEFLGLCQAEMGGFGGGPRQMPHLAATYAAVMSLVTIGTPEALNLIDRPKLEEFLLSMCVAPEKGGGLTVHLNGEVDVRGCYTAIAVAHVLHLDKQKIAKRSGMVQFIKQCQSFEGGLGGEPGNEAHGGYTFCGLAALCLLDQVEVLNVAALLRWVVHMQGSVEGGFLGRTHKLVDGCYSYWQGTIFALLRDVPAVNQCFWEQLVPSLEVSESLDDLPLYEADIGEYSAHEEAKNQGEQKLRKRATQLGLNLQEALDHLVKPPNPEESYDRRILLDLFRLTFEECQKTIQSRDTAFSEMFPIGSVDRDELPLHSSESVEHEMLFDAVGLQLWVLLHCQMGEGGLRDKPNKAADLYHTCYCLSGLAVAQQYSGVILGPKENKLQEVDPVLNVVKPKAQAAMEYFKRLDEKDKVLEST